MSMLKRDINFFSVIGQDSSGFAIDFEKCIKISLIIFGAIAAVIIGIMVVINGGLSLKRKSLESDIAALEEPLKRVEELKAQSEQLQMDIDVFKQSVAEFDVEPRLTVADMEKIAVCMPASVSISSFNYGNGSVSLACVGDSELAIADFANSLRNSQTQNPEPTSEDDYYIKDFQNVSYSGVSRSGDTFTSSITVTLKDRAPAEAPVEEAPAEGEEAEGEESEEGAEK